MAEAEEQKRWLDFQKLKTETPVPLVLEELGLLDRMTEKNGNMVGVCPLHEGGQNKQSFSIQFGGARVSVLCLQEERELA